MSIHLKWENARARCRYELSVRSTDRGPSAEFLTFPHNAKDDEPPSKLEAGPLSSLAPSVRDTLTSQQFADLLEEVRPGDTDLWLIDVLDAVFPAEEFA